MDHRSVPIEVLRDFILSQTELSSVRRVAAEVGLGRTTLQKFVSGKTTPHPRIRRLLALWYLRKVSQAPDIDVARPYAAAVDILLSEIPPDRRAETEQRLIEVLAEVHASGGEPPPRWIELLRTNPTDLLGR